MLLWTIGFLVVALLAAAVGLPGVAVGAAILATAVFVPAIAAVAAVSLYGNRGTTPPTPPAV
jgi:uncharacterized membrane protein YtjA (UPF0391 family)